MSSEERIGQVESSSGDASINEEDEMHKNDLLRLFSFEGWDNETQMPRQVLVCAGFYLSRQRRIRCAWCKQDLPYNFRPIQLYSAHQLSCPKAEETRALLMAAQGQTQDLDSFDGMDSEGTSESQDQLSQTEGAAHNARVLSRGGEACRALGVVGGGARHPARAPIAARRATFATWPADRAQSPAALSDAGFFYTGVDDQVRCFYCDGGLGKWEASDEPWREHARWFPTCGYVLLVKGAAYVEESRDPAHHEDTATLWSGVGIPRRYTGALFPVTENQVEQCMEGGAVAAALSAGLDIARVRRAVVRRLRSTGLPFGSSEGLIDAVLNQQLDEDWEASPRARNLVHNLFEHRLNNIANAEAETTNPPSLTPTLAEDPEPSTTVKNASKPDRCKVTDQRNTDINEDSDKCQVSLEEENRLLKEARLCKVCMDNEVSAVFLPCGHLAACGGCGAALTSCPLCRAPVKALVRAYLA